MTEDDVPRAISQSIASSVDEDEPRAESASHTKLDNVAYPGGYEVRFTRSWKTGKTMHTVQVQYGNCTAGASGKDLAETFRKLADRLDEKMNGGPVAEVVSGTR